MSSALGLDVRGIRVGYDRVDVLQDVSLVAPPGEITCLLGANGSGKSTLVRAVLGLTPPRDGEILLGGKRISGLPTHQIVGRGIGAIPEGRRVFPKLTVEENLRTGAYLVGDRELVSRRMANVYETFPRLRERASQLAGTLSGGEQAMVSIGRGLMGSPGLLIIDEPSLGLSPKFVKENFQVIRRINESGVSVLLVEQNVHQTLEVSHRGYLLSGGKVVASGTAAELKRHPELVAAYFGDGQSPGG
jgi:branched-chain amino acid transport system ATP-binding protein